MIKLIIFAIAAYVVYRLFVNDFLNKKKAQKKMDQEEADRKIAAGDMVKDPECGVYVSVEDSITVRDGDKIYYFCSYDCRDNFLKKLGTGGHVLPEQESK